MERRQHHRVRLHLPVRFRWVTPFGQRIEVRGTEDVSRGGLRMISSCSAFPGMHLWVTFPYDASLPDGQPEIPARVIRSVPGKPGEAAVAVHFEAPASPAIAPRNGKPHTAERRAGPRRRLALPVRVRLEHLPWFEEAMTLDISADGLRFLSTREYEPGAYLFLSFDPGSVSLWPAGYEYRTLVVRTRSQPESNALEVSVCRIALEAVRAPREVFQVLAQAR
jgi:hypothetical protein